MLVLTATGERAMLQALLDRNPVLRLYVNDVSPAKGTTRRDLAEASRHGYASKALPGALWKITGSDPAAADFSEQTFSITGALGKVYGYFLTDPLTGDLLWAERFDASNCPQPGDWVTPEFGAAGGTQSVTPHFELK